MRRPLAVLAAAVVLGAAACTRSSEQGPVGVFRGTGDITFACGKDVSQGAQLRRLVARWNHDHPDQRVDFQELPNSVDQQRAQLVAVAQDHRDPSYDVVCLDVIWTAEFAHGGYIVPLDPAEFPLDRFVRLPLDSARYDGKLWALPLNTNAGLLYYRKDLLAAAALQPPTTWAELARDARLLSRHDHIGGYAGQFLEYEGLTVNVMEAIWAHGGEALADDGTRVVIDSPASEQALGALAAGFRDGWVPGEAITYTEEQGRMAFQAGRLAFLRNWPYAYNLLQDEGSPVRDRFGLAPLPGPSALGGQNLAVTATARNRRTALELMKFLTSEESQRVLFVQGGFPSVLTSVYSDPSIVTRYPYAAKLLYAIEHARTRPVSPYYDQVSKDIAHEAELVLQVRKGPGQAVTDLAAELEDAVTGR